MTRRGEDRGASSFYRYALYGATVLIRYRGLGGGLIFPGSLFPEVAGKTTTGGVSIRGLTIRDIRAYVCGVHGCRYSGDEKALYCTRGDASTSLCDAFCLPSFIRFTPEESVRPIVDSLVPVSSGCSRKAWTWKMRVIDR